MRLFLLNSVVILSKTQQTKSKSPDAVSFVINQEGYLRPIVLLLDYTQGKNNGSGIRF